MKIFKYIVAIIFSVGLTGCATIKSSSGTTSALGNGVWVGTLNFESIKKNNDREQRSHDLLIASCNESIRIWTSNEKNGSYKMIDEKFTIQSYPGTHLIYFLDAAPQQPDWVEIQSYLLMEIDSYNAVVQYSRAVNNRDVNSLHDNRYFTHQGIANLRRMKTSCEIGFNP